MNSLFSFNFPGKPNSRFNILFTGPASSGRTAFLLRHLKGRYTDPLTTSHFDSAIIKRENCILNIVDKDVYIQSNQSYNFSWKKVGDGKIERNGFSINNRSAKKMQSMDQSTINCEGSNHIDGILFFIDSSDHGRIPLARRLLLQLIETEHKKPPILIVATKQDVLGALSPGELAAKLNIEDILSMFEDQVWDYGIIGVSSYTGLGCNEALDWISEAIWQRQSFCYCIPFNSFCYKLYNSSILMFNF